MKDNNFYKWLHHKVSNTAPLWQKIMFYVVASIFTIIALCGIFIGLIFLIRPLRTVIPISLIPWIYVGVYTISVGIVFIAIHFIIQKMRTHKLWGSFFITKKNNQKKTQ